MKSSVDYEHSAGHSFGRYESDLAKEPAPLKAAGTIRVAKSIRDVAGGPAAENLYVGYGKVAPGEGR